MESVFARIWEMFGRIDYLADITWLHFLPFDRDTQPCKKYRWLNVWVK